MKVNFDDITWEMYCEYIGVPVFEPFSKKYIENKNLTNAWQHVIIYDHILQIEDDPEEFQKRSWYQDYFICSMDKGYFLKSGFYQYLVNKNRTELINNILKDGK